MDANSHCRSERPPPIQIPFPGNFTRHTRGMSPAFHITYVQIFMCQADYLSYKGTAKSNIRLALAHAVNLIAATFVIQVQIRVKFAWKAREESNLGSASPSSFHSWAGSNNLIPRALYIQLNAGAPNPYDDPTMTDPPYEIEASFNSKQSWYFGTNAKPPSGRPDFISTILHEFCHGLGFSSGWFIPSPPAKVEWVTIEDMPGCGKGSSITLANAKGELKNGNWISRSEVYEFSTHVFDKTGHNIAATYGSQGNGVFKQLTDNDCYFKSGSGNHRLYCGKTWFSGSSGATHQDPFCGKLMSPCLMKGHAIHDFGEVAPILEAIGWTSLRGRTGSVIPATRATGTETAATAGAPAGGLASDQELDGVSHCGACDKCSTCIDGECVWTNECGGSQCYECHPDTGRCEAPVQFWDRNCEYCDPARGVLPKTHCDSNACFSCNPRDGGQCTNPRMPECPYTPDPDWMNSQHWQCNDWECRGGVCTYFGNPINACDKYQWPLDAPLKDWQCWQPRCVGNGQFSDCRGDPQSKFPLQCPVPPGIDKYCYVYECDGTGYCSKDFFKSKGGPLPGDEHAGNCPVPPQYDARCYWPYCDMTGNCKGDVLTGTKYTRDGNFMDGSQGVRSVPYNINNIPFGSGDTNYPVALCTPADSRDLGNFKYPEWNGDCFKARCEQGKCGGDGVNWDEPCNPVDGRTTGGYNEVFVGQPNWPGVTADCVYYTCGSLPGEFGHCIQRNKVGERKVACHNSDNDLCTNDWCDGFGMCKDHEWVTGHSDEGRCVLHSCDPSTGKFTFSRNGNACCGNAVINTGEECEIGLEGADKRCCVNCYLQEACNDDLVCTDETCSDSGACVSSFNSANAGKCVALDLDVPTNRCRRPACSEFDDCVSEADASKDGSECDAAPDQCNHFVCRSGACVSEPYNVGSKCIEVAGANATNRELIAFDMTCHSFVCQDVSATGKCLPAVDDTLSCEADDDLCTTDVCQQGTCTTVHKVDCPPLNKPCFGTGTCIPAIGKCEYAEIEVGTLCTPLPEPAAHPFDRCQYHICTKAQQCVRHPVECTCGNSRLDDGEVCDWSVAAYRDCCTPDCTGCTCGNGVIEENLGEQCDWGLPDQLACCNSQCQGCTCGNGKLDEDEQCDATAPREVQHAYYCCQNDCTKCADVKVQLTAAVSAVTGVAILFVAITAASVMLYVLYARRLVPPAVKMPSVTPATAATNVNPMYASLQKENPLFVPAAESAATCAPPV